MYNYSDLASPVFPLRRKTITVSADGEENVKEGKETTNRNRQKKSFFIVSE